MKCRDFGRHRFFTNYIIKLNTVKSTEKELKSKDFSSLTWCGWGDLPPRPCEH